MRNGFRFEKQPSEVFCKKRCSQKFYKIHMKTPVPKACNFIKKQTLAQVFSREFCEISKNNFCYKTPPACNFIKKQTLAHSCEFFEIQKNTFCYRTPPACNFIKQETLAQLFSCELCEILRTLFVTEHLRWLLLHVVAEKLQQSKLTS